MARAQTELDNKKQLELGNNGGMHWAHWCIVALSLVLTIGAWYISKTQIEEKVNERFQREATQVVALIKERMALYENALRGAVSFIDANQGEINYPQWQSYANSLHIDETYPGINGIGVIYNIKPADMDAYLKKERSFRPNYALHPQHDKNEYWPITYIEPEQVNAKAVGLDMAFENNRYTGTLKARDSGLSQVTGPITLVQDSKQTPGFLFYTPFYKTGNTPDNLEERRKNIIGVTYAPFIMHKLLQGTLEKQNRNVHLRIRDEDFLLFDDEEISNDAHTNLSKTISTDMYGRTWTFDIWSTPIFNKESSTSQPYVILIGGIIIDSLLLALFIFLSRSNKRAIGYADLVTEELVLRTKHLEKSNQDLEQFAYVASHDLKAPLRGISNIATWLEEDLDPLLGSDSALDEETRRSTLDNIKQLHTRSTRLGNLLESILSYSKAGSKKHSIIKVDVNESLNEIESLLNVDDRFSLVYQELPIIETEKIPFEIVLRNLVSNAMKHHDQDKGTIHISARSAGDFYEFSVTDDGPGIPPEYQEKIFKLFTTLRSRDEVEGSGMGLSTIRKILNYKACSIWVTSKEGERGCSFTFTWPKKEVITDRHQSTQSD